MKQKIKYPNIKVKLTGENGNAFFILGRINNIMKRNKLPKTEIDLFMQEAISGDYNNLLSTCMKWFDCR